jgi:hypothetical protein
VKELFEFLNESSLPVILVILGFAFTLLANAVSVKNVTIHDNRRNYLGWVGLISIILGLIFYSLDNIPEKWNIIEPSDIAYKEVISTTITQVSTYSIYGDGDVLIKTERNISDCGSGFWLRPSDPGFSSNLSLAIQALTHNMTVNVLGVPADKWPGSSGTVCRLHVLEAFPKK